MDSVKRTLHRPYLYILLGMGVFVAFALALGPPAETLAGLWRIIRTRSLLVTDYIEVGGISAALLNAALTGIASALVMHFAGAKPNGALIMGIWLTVGFSFFGKNIFNIVPITLGVWLYSRFQKEPFLNYSLTALLASTLAPLVGEFAFMGRWHPLLEMLFGLLAGMAAGFLMPIVAAATTRVHGGYDLYNVGFAGGLIAVFVVAFCRSANIELPKPLLWSEGNNVVLAIFMYTIMVGWMLCGLLEKNRKKHLKNCKKILEHSGRLVSDYYLLYHEAVYINMGLLGILGTTVTLVLGAPLNGVTMAGIFTMMAFGSFGKHLRNCIPIMIGATLAAAWNQFPFVGPSNICGILFGTGLAPIAGQYGMVWGIVAGVLHITIVAHVGEITGGLNLYNNGFAAGFVALVLVPIILAFRRGKSTNEAEV